MEFTIIINSSKSKIPTRFMCELVPGSSQWFDVKLRGVHPKTCQGMYWEIKAMTRRVLAKTEREAMAEFERICLKANPNAVIKW